MSAPKHPSALRMGDPAPKPWRIETGMGTKDNIVFRECFHAIGWAVGMLMSDRRREDVLIRDLNRACDWRVTRVGPDLAEYRVTPEPVNSLARGRQTVKDEAQAAHKRRHRVLDERRAK